MLVSIYNCHPQTPRRYTIKTFSCLNKKQKYSILPSLVHIKNNTITFQWDLFLSILDIFIKYLNCDTACQIRS